MSDQLERALMAAYPASRWRFTRRPEADETVIDLQCRCAGRLTVSDQLLECVKPAGEALLHEIESLYHGVHRRLTDWARPAPYETLPVPYVACRACGESSPMPAPADVDSYEFCERQAVLWMERAQAIQARGR